MGRYTDERDEKVVDRSSERINVNGSIEQSSPSRVSDKKRNARRETLEIDTPGADKAAAPERPLSDAPLERDPGTPESSRDPNNTTRPRDINNARQVYQLRDVTYRLNAAQVEAVRAIGSFRTVTADALMEHVYRGNKSAFERDLRQLCRQNLAIVSTREGRPGERFVSLTMDAKKLAEAHLILNPDQRIYAGALKHRELDHDVAIYAMYHKGLEKIASEGGSPTRVLLDYEFKESLNRDIQEAKALPRPDTLARLETIAEAHHLKVVDEHIPVPDLRIEYETRDGDMAHLDLEFVTPNYRAGAIAEKARAGFTLYGDGGSGGRRIRHEYPSLAAEILSL